MNALASFRLLVAAAFIVAASAADAQDCGVFCEGCPSAAGYEGTGWIPGGTYNMSCVVAPTCTKCVVSAPNRSDVAVEGLIDRINTEPSHALRGEVQRYGSRLVVLSHRQLIIVRGNDCDATAAVVVGRATPERIRLLVKLGVREWKPRSEKQ